MQGSHCHKKTWEVSSRLISGISTSWIRLLGNRVIDGLTDWNNPRFLSHLSRTIFMSISPFDQPDKNSTKFWKKRSTQITRHAGMALLKASWTPSNSSKLVMVWECKQVKKASSWNDIQRFAPSFQRMASIWDSCCNLHSLSQLYFRFKFLLARWSLLDSWLHPPNNRPHRNRVNDLGSILLSPCWKLYP